MLPNKLLLTFFIFTFCGPEFFANEKVYISYPIFSLFSSASYGSGLRLGSRIQISEHFSFEGSWGKDVVNFVSPSNPNLRYSFGANWHSSRNSRFIINFTYTHAYYPPDFIVSQHLFLVNIGSLFLQEKGFHLFYEGGILLNYKKNLAGNSLYILPNFELGLGFIF
jgi:hypothetical protein